MSAGHTIIVPETEPVVVLCWGDGTASTCVDTGAWITSGFADVPPLQRALMATRLRFILDALLETEPGGPQT